MVGGVIMDKQTVIEYVIHTPINTNKNVLSTMLDQLVSSSGGIDPNEDYVLEGGEISSLNDVEINFDSGDI